MGFLSSHALTHVQATLLLFVEFNIHIFVMLCLAVGLAASLAWWEIRAVYRVVLSIRLIAAPPRRPSIIRSPHHANRFLRELDAAKTAAAKAGKEQEAEGKAKDSVADAAPQTAADTSSATTDSSAAASSPASKSAAKKRLKAE
jgi:hypothetical protein